MRGRRNGVVLGCGRRVTQKTYFARIPECGKGVVSDELEDQLTMALESRMDLRVSFAVDGNPAQWQRLEGITVRVPIAEEPSWLLDFYHCAGYLSVAANAVHPDHSVAAEVLVE